MQFPEPLDEFSAEDQRVVRDHMETVRFAAGECIFRQGSQGDGCFIVEQGEVRLEFADETHVETKCVLAHVTQGSLLGELAVLDGRPRSAAAFAETDVVAQYLSSVAVDQICSRHPQVGVGLMRALGRDASLKLRRSNERLADFIAVDTPDPEVDAMVARAAEAQREFEDWPEERVDALLLALAQAGAHHAEALAHATVKETRIGNVADKAIKNRNASLCVYESLAGKPGRGIVAVDADRRVTEIASPAGVVFGIVPVTAPVATAIFKTLIALKARCALILSFHRACLGVGTTVCEIMQAILIEHRAPADLLQWVRKRSSRIKTVRFMRHRNVSLILATGGAGMVEAAYSSGTPALGVGPGNSPTYVAADADVAAAAQAIAISKTFDNGLVCGAESNLVVDALVRDAFVAALEHCGAAMLTADEARHLATVAIEPGGRNLDVRVTGQSAQTIADVLGIRRGYPIKLIVIPTPVGVLDQGSALAGEKLAPMLSLFTVYSQEEAFALCRRLLAFQGCGHAAIIHTQSDERANQFGLAMPASRIVVNSPGSQGISGVTTGLIPSMTLGCGTFGGNSTTDNVSYRNLQNIKRLAHFLQP